MTESLSRDRHGCDKAESDIQRRLYQAAKLFLQQQPGFNRWLRRSDSGGYIIICAKYDLYIFLSLT